MRIELAPPPRKNILVFLRGLGYMPHRDPHEGKESFVRRLGSNFYPRLHVYVAEYSHARVVLDLHLDAKRPSYEGQRMHAAEHDSPLVADEADRIRAYGQSV